MEKITVICNVEHIISPGVCALCQRDEAIEVLRDLVVARTEYLDPYKFYEAVERACMRAHELVTRYRSCDD